MNAKKKTDELKAEAPAEQQADGMPYDSGGLQTRIQQRAYDLWLERGGGDGDAEQDWFRAEAEINAAIGEPPQAPALGQDEPRYSQRAVAS
jgi:hypothetical protein